MVAFVCRCRQLCMLLAIMHVVQIAAKMEVTTHERRENLYPMEVRVQKLINADSEGGKPACFHATIEIEHDCTQAKTCGCKSSVLSLKIAGGKEIVRSRLDEISNVFERDVLVFNVTLCDRDAGLVVQETRTFYVEMIAALFRSEGGKPVSMICQNISSDGEVGECVSMSGFQQTSTVVVTGISTGNESCANPEAAAKMLNDAKSRIQAGDPSSALQSLNRILQDDKLENDRQKKEAARIRNALLPPFTLSHRCCDSMNTYCTSIDKSLLFATDSGVEKDILKIVGSDQCSGLFVEIGAGDGVTDSPTLFLEKYMGWKGALFEENSESFKFLTNNGRSAMKYQDGFRLSGEKFDARDTMIKDMLDLSHDGIQILFLNIAGVSQVEALKALNLTPSAGGGMLVPYTYLLAVELDPATQEEVKTLLAAKDYAWQGELGQAGKGRRYDVFHYTFPSHLMEEVMKQVAPQ
uniref:Uncharacterized protein n=1 Tax=Hanusia phi TaxID=3032 RepID=A0A7S0E2G0_9CRYP